MHAWRASALRGGKCSSTPNLLTRPGRSKTQMVLEVAQDVLGADCSWASQELGTSRPSATALNGAFAGAHGSVEKTKKKRGRS